MFFFFPLEEVHSQLFVAFHWFVNTYFTFMHGVEFQERRKAWNKMKPRESLLSFSYWCLPLLVIWMLLELVSKMRAGMIP